MFFMFLRVFFQTIRGCFAELHEASRQTAEDEPRNLSGCSLDKRTCGRLNENLAIGLRFRCLLSLSWERDA
jgi:hypothetical protein